MKYKRVSFNPSRPDSQSDILSMAAMQGATAVLTGQTDNDNPYEESSANYVQWHQSFTETRYIMNCEATPDFSDFGGDI